MAFGHRKVIWISEELRPTPKEQWKKAWRIARKMFARADIDRHECRRPSVEDICRYKGVLGYALQTLNDRNFSPDPISMSPQAHQMANKMVDEFLAKRATAK